MGPEWFPAVYNWTDLTIDYSSGSKDPSFIPWEQRKIERRTSCVGDSLVSLYNGAKKTLYYEPEKSAIIAVILIFFLTFGAAQLIGKFAQTQDGV